MKELAMTTVYPLSRLNVRTMDMVDLTSGSAECLSSMSPISTSLLLTSASVPPQSEKTFLSDKCWENCRQRMMIVQTLVSFPYYFNHFFLLNFKKRLTLVLVCLCFHLFLFVTNFITQESDLTWSCRRSRSDVNVRCQIQYVKVKGQICFHSQETYS